MNDGRALAAGLLAAAEWFNDALLDRLVAAGWPRLSRNQSLVFTVLDATGTTPAELARRLGITRQSTHVLLGELAAGGIVTLVDHPGDRRSRLVLLSARGKALARNAVHVLSELEAELADRIGERHVAALRAATALDWGPPPTAGRPGQR